MVCGYTLLLFLEEIVGLMTSVDLPEGKEGREERGRERGEGEGEGREGETKTDIN